jgi:hypothetical protein
MSTTFLTIDRGVITGDHDDNAIISVKFNSCNDETIWDECVTRYPNVRELWFNNCSNQTDLLLELCGRVDKIRMTYCDTEFVTTCVSRFSGHMLRVVVRYFEPNLIVPAFLVARLKHLELFNCVVTDDVIECIVGARLLEQLDLTRCRVSNTQMRHVIDNIQHIPLKNFVISDLSDENHEKLQTVYRGKSVLRYVSMFTQLNFFVSSNWFENCVSFLASKRMVSKIPREIWRRLFSEYLPKP